MWDPDIHISKTDTKQGYAGTIGLMKVAQLRHTTIATAIGNASTPKDAPIAIITGEHSIEIRVGIEAKC